MFGFLYKGNHDSNPPPTLGVTIVLLLKKKEKKEHIYRHIKKKNLKTLKKNERLRFLKR